MDVGGMKGYSFIIMEDVREDDLQNLGGRLVLMLMRASILIGGVVVVAVGVMGVAAMGVISFSEELCLSVMQVKFLGYGLV